MTFVYAHKWWATEPANLAKLKEEADVFKTNANDLQENKRPPSKVSYISDWAMYDVLSCYAS